MKIDVVEGNLASFKADAIVNSANLALLLNLGGMSQNISQAAGPGLQTECSASRPNGLNFGELVVTGGHNLKCHRVYHVSVPSWDSVVAEGPKVLEQVVLSCLEQAHTDRMTSIAFPTLGCGYLGHPPVVVAETMKHCIQKFEHTHFGTTLWQLYFVVFPKATDRRYLKKVFEDVLVGGMRITRSTIKRVQKARAISSNTCDEPMEVDDQCSDFNNQTSLETDCPDAAGGQTIDDDCIICYTEKLSEAPAIQLKCGHMFHLECTQRMLHNEWNGARISFNFTTCPICKEPMEHPELQSLLEPFRALHDDVKRKGVMRLMYEELDKSDLLTNPNSPYYNKPELYAMERYCYYLCFTCKKPYFGGAAQCEGGAEAEVKPEELVCSPCSGSERPETCATHGTDFIEYKCRFCCSVATFYCFGTTHFCNTCHNNHGTMVNMEKEKKLPPCPAGPNGKQLEGECPLVIKHPPTGSEYCLGCGLCSNLQTF